MTARQQSSAPWPLEHAQQALLAQARPVADTEVCRLQDSDGRVLAQDLVSPIDVPGFDNSAMDGFALNLGGLETPGEFTVVQRIVAGQTGSPLLPGQAARIMTGAAIPEGCDVVVPQEDTAVVGDKVQVRCTVQLGRHIRRRGEDIARGQVVLVSGTAIKAKHLGLAASVGVERLKVFRRLKVGLFWTGDELLEPGQALRPGMIYNTNRYALGSLLKSLGCEITDYGTVRDDATATRQALAKAAADNDVILTSGGVSVGEEDHVKAAVTALGELAVWKVAIKPGKPFAFGRVGQADFIGLPGNPVSAYVTFMLLAAPFIRCRQGRTDCYPRRLQAMAGFEWLSKTREFVRVVQDYDEDDRPVLKLSSSRQGAAAMTSIALADGLADIQPGEPVRPGQWVAYYPLQD